MPKAKKTETVPTELAPTPVPNPYEAPEVPLQFFVTRTFENKLDHTETVLEETEDVISVHKFQTEPALVRYGQQMTLNLGNYESIKIDVAVTVPTYREELTQAYGFAEEFVQSKVMQLVKEIRDGKAKKKFEDPF